MSFVIFWCHSPSLRPQVATWATAEDMQLAGTAGFLLSPHYSDEPLSLFAAQALSQQHCRTAPCIFPRFYVRCFLSQDRKVIVLSSFRVDGPSWVSNFFQLIYVIIYFISVLFIYLFFFLTPQLSIAFQTNLKGSLGRVPGGRLESR